MAVGSRGDADEIVALVQLLCQHVVGAATLRDDTQELALRLLSSRLFAPIVVDVMHVRHLAHKQLTQKAPSGLQHKLLRLDELIALVSDYDSLQEKGAILYTLLVIAAQDNTASATGFNLSAPVRRIHDRQDAIDPVPVALDAPEQNIADVHRALQQELPDSESMDLSESDLLRDLIFAFQGVESTTIRFSPNTDSFQLSTKVHMPLSCHNMMLQLCELGRMFRRVNEFIKQPQHGLVHQAFVASLKRQLAQYYRLLAVLETQLHQALVKSSRSLDLTLRQLLVWIQRPLQTMKVLALLADSAQGWFDACPLAFGGILRAHCCCCAAAAGRKGGALLSTLERCRHHGDPFVSNLVKDVLKDSSAPFFTFLQRWISNGDIVDPFSEFFIVENQDAHDDRFWQDRYTMRREMAPSFLGADLSKKIMVVGKSINFIRRCSEDLHSNSSICKSFSDIGYGDVSAIGLAVDRASDLINSKLSDIVYRANNFRQHCLAIKNYLLLGQGDFIQHLMDLLFVELNKAADKMYRHNLVSLLESAIRSSNAQYDDADVLSRLCVRVLQPSPGDQGWDVFSLDYRIDAPLNVVFTNESMERYLRLFNFLWRLKRLEHCLAVTWKRHNSHAARLRDLDGIQGLLHKGHILRNEMVHFVDNLHSFLKFEVLECSWTEFSETCEKAHDLDYLVEAHENYTQQLLSKALMGGLEGKSELQNHLMNLCDCILRFGHLQDRMYDAALEEIERRHHRDVEAMRRSELGQWGYTGGEGVEADPARAAQIAVRFSSQLDDVAEQYRTELSAFLERLAQQRYPSDLRFLSFRLDFNEFYHPKLVGKNADARKESADRTQLSLDDIEGNAYVEKEEHYFDEQSGLGLLELER